MASEHDGLGGLVTVSDSEAYAGSHCMPSTIRAQGLFIFAWCVATLYCLEAWSAVPDALHLEAKGACPSAETIRRQLRPLLPATRVRLVQSRRGPSARVVDSGSSFSIEVGDAQRTIVDPARDCVERARISAVFIALVLDPPLIAPRASDSVASEPPPQLAPAPASVRGSEVSMAAGVLISAALGSSGSRVWGLGPSLGLALGNATGEVAVSGALLTPFTFEFSTGTVRMLRLPFDLGYRVVTPAGAAAVAYVGLAMQADLLHISGLGFERSVGSVRVALGARAALGMRYPVTPAWAGFVEFSAAYFPRPYRLEVEPSGSLGWTPGGWVSFTLGMLR